MVELTDNTLLELAAKHIGKVPDSELIPDLCKHWPMSTGDADESDLIAFARAAIAADRARRPTPQPPADGDASTVIPWLLEMAVMAANSDSPYSAGMLTLAAQLIGEGVDEDAPQHPADGEVGELARYGVDWNGIPANPLIVPMEDGYWTPWHIATALLQRLASPACLVIDPGEESVASRMTARIVGPNQVEMMPAYMQLIKSAERTVLVPVAQPVEKDCGSWPDASNDS